MYIISTSGGSTTCDRRFPSQSKSMDPRSDRAGSVTDRRRFEVFPEQADCTLVRFKVFRKRAIVNNNSIHDDIGPLQPGETW